MIGIPWRHPRPQPADEDERPVYRADYSQHASAARCEPSDDPDFDGWEKVIARHCDRWPNHIVSSPVCHIGGHHQRCYIPKAKP
ncbi:MAG TPA: hypothetical protein VGB14_06150 [Acidimicrobiales bacterium]